MKKILFLLLLLLSQFSFAQMDNEHWFAPMANTAKNGEDMMELYLSTNSATPFYVKIENNRKVVDSVQIAKGNPKSVDISEEMMVTDSVAVATTKGLHVWASGKFFANLRFSEANHAEIITSKGRAGLGMHFFNVYAPFSNKSSVLNFTTGVVATEDNTQVNVFGNTVTLNRGKSFIIKGFPMDNSFIGAEITSDKPISVTNGNFNGQYASADTRAGSDILMDQSVPVERLGKEYILMKGNGNTTSGMESAVVVATEDGTEIFVNGGTTAYTTLNKGEYFLLPSSFYTSQTHGSVNVYLKSTKNIYVFQLLSGSGSMAAGGFNYIPPLNCYLPKKIDELGFIDENPGYDGNGNFTRTHSTKLNIITQAGAAVKVNGTNINGIYGPDSVPGTSEWQTFTIPNVSGTLVIESEKAVTAGIAAGDSAVGYGGYFAGASSQPVITKSGSCIPGGKLEVEDAFDSYQWQRKNPSTGVFENIAGATSFSYTPTQAGEFAAVLGSKSCGQITTPSYILLPCSSTSSVSATVCSSLTISPRFTNTALTVDSAKTRIVNAPTKGTATVSDGIIYYVPADGFTDGSTDSFSYYMEDGSIYPESEIVTVNIVLKKITVYNSTLTSCITNGKGNYDLTTAKVTDGSYSQIFFYENPGDAQVNNTAAQIANPSNFISEPKTVYAVLKTTEGCLATANIELKGYELPQIDLSKFNGKICDDDLDGQASVTLSAITSQILANANSFDVNYSVGGVPVSGVFSFSNNVTLRAEIKSRNGCPSVFVDIPLSVGERIPVNNVGAKEVCDSNLAGSVSVDLAAYSKEFSSADATFYRSESDAKNKTNSIASTQNISANTTFYLRFESATGCPNIGVLQFVFKQPKKSEILQDMTVCKDATTELHAGTGFESYLWSTGSLTENSGMVGAGDYWVDLGLNGCVYRQIVSVKTAQNPVITAINISENNIFVDVSGGTAPYLFALDGGAYQSGNSFAGLTRGKHMVFVKDANGCEPVQKEFSIIMLINAITPDGDGINDYLDYSDLSLKNNVVFQIFDRYGKLVYDANGKTYKWDGKTSDGRALPTAAYWYVLSWTEPGTNTPVTFKGWVLVKNR